MRRSPHERRLGVQAHQRPPRQLRLDPGASELRQARTHHDTHVGACERSCDRCMTHHADHTDKAWTAVVERIACVRHHRHTRADLPDKGRQLAPRIAPGDTIAGDHQHAARPRQQIRGLLHAIGGRGTARGRRQEPVCRRSRIDCGALHILRQQQDRRTGPIAARGRQRVVQRAWQVIGVRDAVAIDRHRGEQRLQVHRSAAPAAVLKGSASVERGRWLSDHRQQRHVRRISFGQRRNQIERAASRRRHHDSQRRAHASVAVGHGGG